MAYVDTSKGEWRCECPTPGDPSAYDLSAHSILCPQCRLCGDRNPHFLTEEEIRKAVEQGERDRAAVVAAEGTGWVDTGMRFR